MSRPFAEGLNVEAADHAWRPWLLGWAFAAWIAGVVVFYVRAVVRGL